MKRLWPIASLVAGGLLVGCGGEAKSGLGNQGGGGEGGSEEASGPGPSTGTGVGGASTTGTGATSSGGAGPSGTGQGGAVTSSTSAMQSSATGPVGCNSGPDDDADMDGITPAQGDCNDCDPNANPAAVEVIVTEADMNGNVPPPADEDCDGLIDNVAPPCDGAFALTDVDPMNGAKVLELCKLSSGANDWGVVSAAYVRSNGSPTNPGNQVGIQNGFGPNVATQGGSQLLALSSGRARLPGQVDACGTNTCDGIGPGVPPPGFPQDSAGCVGGTEINDDVALELTLRAPSNATGYKFNFGFYSFEYPEWVCTTYNDQFIALVAPPPIGAINGNISFDGQSNPVSVNVAFFQVCDGCPLGTNELVGTGFDGAWGDDAGATSWLTTEAPIGPLEEFTIRFAIWDTGDQAWDSTALVDNFQWIGTGAVEVQTHR